MFDHNKWARRGAKQREVIEEIVRQANELASELQDGHELPHEERIGRDWVQTYLTIFIRVYLLDPNLITQFLLPNGDHIKRIRNLFHEVVLGKINTFSFSVEEKGLLLAGVLNELTQSIFSITADKFSTLESTSPEKAYPPEKGDNEE